CYVLCFCCLFFFFLLFFFCFFFFFFSSRRRHTRSDRDWSSDVCSSDLAALGNWGAWVNSYAKAEYGRPLFIGASADLAESTNLAGFGKDFGDLKGWGWYERDSNPRGTVLPTQITEFTNAGLAVGMATVNMSPNPFDDFNGFWGT